MPTRITKRLNRRKTTSTRPRTGTTPTILTVAATGPGQPNALTITFDTPVIVPAAPDWWTIGLDPDLRAQSIVSNDAGLTVILDFGAPVGAFTGIRVPQGDTGAVTASGKAVPPGSYMA